jgi:hypothetical protein
VSVRKGSDCVSRWHFNQEYGWLSCSGELSTLRDERNDNEQETKTIFLSLSPDARIPHRLRRQRHHTAALLEANILETEYSRN